MQQIRSRGSWTRRLALLVFGLIVGPLASRGAAACIGDCNGDGTVTVNELILMTSIALNLTPVSLCTVGDASGDGTITVNEIISAVNNALGVCPPSPPTPTPTATEKPTDTPTQAATDTPPPTATNTAPPINTATATSAPPEATLTPTPSPTPPQATPTVTSTPPAQSTATPTNTAAATVASSPTPTATTVIPASPTPTSSPSPTATTASGLGSRTFTLVAGTATTGSGYYSSFLGPSSKAGVPSGSMVLVAGGKDASGHAAVTVTGPAYITVPVTLGGLTICTKIESCTGDLYCNGGTNVDTTEKLDSLKSGLSCVQDGTGNCPSAAANVCCSNACEGVGVGSGNSIVSASGVNPATNSGAGALLLICMQRVTTVDKPTGVNCATQDYSANPLEPAQYTTGSSTASLSHHCAGTAAGNKANVVPTFTKTGTNFDCANWTSATGPGAFASSLPAEQPSDIIVGDGAQAEVLAGH